MGGGVEVESVVMGVLPRQGCRLVSFEVCGCGQHPSSDMEMDLVKGAGFWLQKNVDRYPHCSISGKVRKGAEGGGRRFGCCCGRKEWSPVRPAATREQTDHGPDLPEPRANMISDPFKVCLS